MSFSELGRAAQYSASSHWQAAHRSFPGSSSNPPDTYLLEKIVEHVLELPAEQQSTVNAASSVVNTPTTEKNNKNPYLGWARCPTFSIPPVIAQKMAAGRTGTETYEGFFSKLESSKRATVFVSPATAAAGGSYYRHNYDLPLRKTPRSSPHQVSAVPVAFRSLNTPRSSNQLMDTLTTPPSEDGTVDPRLVCPPPSFTSHIDVSHDHSAPTTIMPRPPPGFEVSSAEKELIKIFPSYSQSIKVIPAVIFCNRCKQEIPTDPQAIFQHATIHLINPKEDPNKFGCLVGNCWRRLPLPQLGTHVAGHFQTARASCGLCGLAFASPQLAREHLVSPCSQLQDERTANFLITRPAVGRKAQEI